MYVWIYTYAHVCMFSRFFRNMKCLKNHIPLFSFSLLHNRTQELRLSYRKDFNTEIIIIIIISQSETVPGLENISLWRSGNCEPRRIWALFLDNITRNRLVYSGLWKVNYFLDNFLVRLVPPLCFNLNRCLKQGRAHRCFWNRAKQNFRLSGGHAGQVMWHQQVIQLGEIKESYPRKPVRRNTEAQNVYIALFFGDKGLTLLM